MSVRQPAWGWAVVTAATGTVLIGIGATRYTPLGESTFLKQGDEAIVRVKRTNG
mgnify:CR=1 FL=1